MIEEGWGGLARKKSNEKRQEKSTLRVMRGVGGCRKGRREKKDRET